MELVLSLRGVQKEFKSSNMVQKEFKKLKGWSSAFNLIHTCFEDGAASFRRTSLKKTGTICLPVEGDCPRIVSSFLDRQSVYR